MIKRQFLMVLSMHYMVRPVVESGNQQCFGQNMQVPGSDRGRTSFLKMGRNIKSGEIRSMNDRQKGGGMTLQRAEAELTYPDVAV